MEPPRQRESESVIQTVKEPVVNYKELLITGIAAIAIAGIVIVATETIRRLVEDVSN